MIQIPTSSDITIEIDGRRLAVAQGYRAKTIRDTRYVEAFGAAEPVGTAGGKVRHQLELSRVVLDRAGDIDFHGIADFNVVIAKPGRSIVYTGCTWLSIDESAALGGTVLESVSIAASRRMVLP